MDEIARYNLARWEALAEAKAIFTRPNLQLTLEAAQAMVDPAGRLGPIAGRPVLCLAGGGGQQSAAFALLGAEVTVVDLSPSQLERDRQAAAHYQLTIKTVESDMRDLSHFEPNAFDIVYHPHSLNFVPDARQVFAQVARVLRPGGRYYFNCANPFTMGLLLQDWNGQGYPLHLPYRDGAEVHQQDESWVFRGEMPAEPIRPVKMFRHTLGTLVNGLIEQGFVIGCILEENLGQPDAETEPGTSEHFTAVAPPWLAFWATYHGPATT